MEFEYYPLHAEIVGLWRDMPEDRYESMKRDIEENGLIDPITVWMVDKFDQSTWRVVDGRHRQRACQELGIEAIYDERTFDDYDACEAYCNSKNHHRRKDVFRRTRKMKNEATIAELKRDPNRSDRSIAEVAKVGYTLVATWRKKLGLESDTRVSSDGRVNTGTQPENSGDMPVFENTGMPAESPTSGSESANTAESPKIVGVMSQNEIDDMARQLFGSGSAYKNNRGWLKKILNSPVGPAIRERYAGWKRGEGFHSFYTKDLIDLRIGWPNIGKDFSAHLAVKTTTGGGKKIKEIKDRIGDLDRINQANEGKNDYQQSRDSNRFWADMTALTGKPEVEEEVEEAKPETEPKQTATIIQAHQRLEFHGEEIKWHEVEGMNYRKAHCIAMMIDNIYRSHFTLLKQCNGGEISKYDYENFATSVRFIGDKIEGIGGPEARFVVDQIAGAIHRNPDKHQKVGKIHQVDYHTKE